MTDVPPPPRGRRRNRWSSEWTMLVLLMIASGSCVYMLHKNVFVEPPVEDTFFGDEHDFVRTAPKKNQSNANSTRTGRFPLGNTTTSILQDLASNPALQKFFVTPTALDSASKPPPSPATDAQHILAYAISVTSCKNPETSGLLDGAAVLRYSIHQTSIRNANSTSRYDYHLYAFVHDPDGLACVPYLRRLGYRVLRKPSPVALADIGNPRYVQRLTNPHAGCCAEKEFLKLYSYTLDQYTAVIHVDVDVLLLQPLDDLMDLLTQDPSSHRNDTAVPSLLQQHAMYPPGNVSGLEATKWSASALRDRPINSMFTRDYAMVDVPGKDRRQVGMQGGFWIVRPNRTVLEDFIGIIRTGNFEPGQGWGDQKYRYGGFYGAPMIQGIVPYYYHAHDPHESYLELNNCRWNNMMDAPDRDGKCLLTGRPNTTACTDCRQQPLSNISALHYTLCGKPWTCPVLIANATELKKASLDLQWLNRDVWLLNQDQGRVCMKVVREWFRQRHLLETTVWGRTRPVFDDSLEDPLQDVSAYYYGYCQRTVDVAKGTFGYDYQPLQMPSENELRQSPYENYGSGLEQLMLSLEDAGP